MTQPDLSALQRRAYELYRQFGNPNKWSESSRLDQQARELNFQVVELRQAQISPIESAGTAVKPIQPILVKNLSTLLTMAPDLDLDLGHAMSAQSDAHQQPLLQSVSKHVLDMRKVLDKANFKSLLPDEQRAVRKPVVAMAWRVQSELQSRGVDIEAALETYWANVYELHQPSRSAHKAAILNSPRR